MKPKIFPTDIFSQIERTLELESKSQPQPVAAFDADGTLWNADMGESFFQFQIKNHLIPNLPPDPWRHYHDMKAGGDPRPAYLWLAQINKGFSLDKIREWSESNVKEMSPLPIFEEQQTLIEWLISKGVAVYVVTASVKWAVEPAAKQLGIPRDRVLGVATKSNNNILTDIQEGLMTYREGKAAALLQATGGIKPFFCAGNTLGDLHLLKSSTGIALAVQGARKGTELFATENELQSEAKINEWLRYSF
jgi:phosphoserine phosphatase